MTKLLRRRRSRDADFSPNEQKRHVLPPELVGELLECVHYAHCCALSQSNGVFRALLQRRARTMHAIFLLLHTRQEAFKAEYAERFQISNIHPHQPQQNSLARLATALGSRQPLFVCSGRLRSAHSDENPAVAAIYDNVVLFCRVTDDKTYELLNEDFLYKDGEDEGALLVRTEDRREKLHFGRKRYRRNQGGWFSRLLGLQSPMDEHWRAHPLWFQPLIRYDFERMKEALRREGMLDE